MSQQPSYESARQWPASYRMILPVVPVELELRGRDLEPWSG